MFTGLNVFAFLFIGLVVSAYILRELSSVGGSVGAKTPSKRLYGDVVPGGLLDAEAGEAAVEEARFVATFVDAQLSATTFSLQTNPPEVRWGAQGHEVSLDAFWTLDALGALELFHQLVEEASTVGATFTGWSWSPEAVQISWAKWGHTEEERERLRDHAERCVRQVRLREPSVAAFLAAVAQDPRTREERSVKEDAAIQLVALAWPPPGSPGRLVFERASAWLAQHSVERLTALRVERDAPLADLLGSVTELRAMSMMDGFHEERARWLFAVDQEHPPVAQEREAYEAAYAAVLADLFGERSGPFLEVWAGQFLQRTLAQAPAERARERVFGAMQLLIEAGTARPVDFLLTTMRGEHPPECAVWLGGQLQQDLSPAMRRLLERHQSWLIKKTDAALIGQARSGALTLSEQGDEGALTLVPEERR